MPGPTPMRLRKDALVAASKMVTEINALAYRYQPNGRSTVGFMQVKPNSRNVIPGEVRFSVDLRHAEDSALDTMESEMRALVARGSLRREMRLRPSSASPITLPASSIPTAFPPCAKRRNR